MCYPSRVSSAVSLRGWAERVLFGPTLEDKLWHPAATVDDEPGPALDVPRAPGRAPGLALSDEPAIAAPREDALHEPHAVGLLLHSFANHELLALELMALALLRFPEAPAAFRRGVATTLGEEQTHLRLYLQRMQQLGVELGERPLGGLLWRVMAPMPTPLDYVAHMALTFEQANLDFALEHATTLRRVGDETTAAILDRVYADEIGHVKLGLVWFQRWRERGPSLFEAHRRALRAPTTPRRARGVGFDAEGRHQAGLPDEYVERLRCFEASRGRPPVLHWFEPTAELSLGTRGRYTPPAAMQQRMEDLELLPALAATTHDLVVLRRAPSLSYLQQLAEVGLTVPEPVILDAAGTVPVDALPPRLAELRPWGWAAPARERLGPLLDRCDRQPPPRASDAVLHAKSTWATMRAELLQTLREPWLDDPELCGKVLADADADATWELVEQLHARGHETVVLKAPFGTSGRNAQRIEGGTPTVAQRGWLRRTLATQDAVVVEPWLRSLADLSLRITVEPSGRARVDHLGRFLTDPRGQYLGAVLGPLTRALPPTVARWLHDDGRDPQRLDRVMTIVAERVAARVHQHGYAGPVGIDGLIHHDLDDRLRLRPIVEVNVRPTFGHVVLGLQRRLARGAAGLLVMLRVADLLAHSSSVDAAVDAAALDAVARAQAHLPTQVLGNPPRLRRGVVPLADPSRVHATLPLLLVASSRAEALDALHAASPAAAAQVAAALDRGARAPTSRPPAPSPAPAPPRSDSC